MNELLEAAKFAVSESESLINEMNISVGRQVVPSERWMAVLLRLKAAIAAIEKGDACKS